MKSDTPDICFAHRLGHAAAAVQPLCLALQFLHATNVRKVPGYDAARKHKPNKKQESNQVASMSKTDPKPGAKDGEKRLVPEPIIRKFPTEIFGHAYSDKSSNATKSLAEQWCPFLNSECKKPRKSEPHIKVGICSVGYKGSFVEAHKPIIICPHRFRTPEVFDHIESAYLAGWLGDGEKLAWVSEVSLGVSGSVDYVAAKLSKNGDVLDFQCVEFQAGGTTGTPWQAILDLRESGEYASESYDYGINWANEFSKTMMQQVFKKGRVMAEWGKKIIFVLQDTAIAYIRSTSDCSGLVPRVEDHPIHFCTFEPIWDKETRWRLCPISTLSTDVEGIRKIIGGVLVDQYLTTEQFKENIKSKLSRR